MTNHLLRAGLVLALAFSAWAWSSVLAHADEPWLTADEPMAAYTLDHPIDPDRLILATPSGRYQITRTCDWLVAYVNVTVTQGPYAGIFAIVPRDNSEPSCWTADYGLVDPHPCFGYDICDVTYELPEG